MKVWWTSGQSLLQILWDIYGEKYSFYSWQGYSCQLDNYNGFVSRAIFFSTTQEADMGNWDRKLKWRYVQLDLIQACYDILIRRQKDDHINGEGFCFWSKLHA